MFPGLKSEDHLFFFAGNKPRLRRGREDPPRSSRGCLNISRGRFFISIIFIFVKYIVILKPHYIKRKILHFNHFHLSQISSSSSLNISGERFLIFIFVEYINLLKPQHIMRQIFDFRLCQIYQPPHASIYQGTDFLFSSVWIIATSSSLNIS